MSFGVETDLNVIHGRFLEYYTFIQDFLRPHRHTLTGMGINPYYDINRNEPIPNGRYRMLFHHLSSYEKYGEALPFHHNPNFGLFSCASQVQLDVEEGNVAETLNTFSKLEPLKSLLFANSVWGEDHELLCGRDQFWKYSLHGLNPHNVDMYAVEFHSSHEVEEYIRTMSLYCVEREGRYINFPPMPLREYFAAETVTGEYFDGERYRDITFEPRIEDLEYLRSFKFEDLTYRGTVEFRSVCEQPVSEIMAPAAFHAGLLENLHQLTGILDKDVILYQNGYNAVELRELLNRRELPDFLDRDKTSDLLKQILDLARDGLKKRGLDEEHFLDPLYHRAKHLYSPARQIAAGLDSGVPIEYYIEEFAKPV
jgi:gamma-glutamylcysteine synthetase